MRRAAILAIVGALASPVIASAEAARSFIGDGQLNVQAGPSEANDISIGTCDAGDTACAAPEVEIHEFGRQLFPEIGVAKMFAFAGCRGDASENRAICADNFASLDVDLSDTADNLLSTLNKPGVFSGGLGDDDITSGDANDTLNGGTGDDYLEGSRGLDRYDGEAGDDTIVSVEDAVPAQRDTVICGRGRNDVAQADLTDVVSSDCETIRRAPVGSHPTVAIAPAPVRVSRGGRGAITLICPRGQQNGCRGRVRFSRGVRALGGGSYGLRPRRRAVVRFALRPAERRRLERARRLIIRATASETDPQGRPKTTIAELVLLPR